MRVLEHSLTMLGVTGILWGWICGLGLAIVLTLASGVAIAASGAATGLAGICTAFLLFYLGNLRARYLIATAFAATVLAVTEFPHPFGLNFSAHPMLTALVVIGFALSLVFILDRCLSGLPDGTLNRHLFERHLIRSAIGIGYVFFTTIVVLPFYIMVMTSLKSQQALISNPLDFSIDLSAGVAVLFRSYRELFTLYDFGTFLINTSVISVLTVVITLLFCVPGAYAVARLRFPGRKAFSRSILLIYMVPTIVLVIPLYAVFSQLGLRNSFTGLLIVYPATTIPVALYMLQGYFRGLPYELEEAGLMDGLSRIQVIIKITLPLAMPAMATVSLYVFMIAWNEFLFAFMFLDDPSLFTLSRGIVSLNSSEVPRQHLMAGAVIATLPVLFLFLWFERFLVQGLASGGVKG